MEAVIPGLAAAFAAAGAAAWGAVPYARLAERMAPEAVGRAEALCPSARTVLVAAFPYYAGERAGNLSVYARGEDYHLVLVRRLNTICDFLKQEYPEDIFLPGADSSPLPEREAARLAGVGLRGRNGLVIVPPYGSYVFLGTILTGAALAVSPAAPSDVCISCGKCLDVCPTGALDGAVFHAERCLSALTQKKRALDPGEEALLRVHPLVWGCDFCQSVCPYNRAAVPTPLPEFSQGLVDSLAGADLEGLTNRQFRERYGHRAFAWRGPAVLRRNLTLKPE